MLKTFWSAMLKQNKMATKVNTPLNYVSLFSCAGVGCYGFKQEGFACIARLKVSEGIYKTALVRLCSIHLKTI